MRMMGAVPVTVVSMQEAWDGTFAEQENNTLEVDFERFYRFWSHRDGNFTDPIGFCDLATAPLVWQAASARTSVDCVGEYAVLVLYTPPAGAHVLMTDHCPMINVAAVDLSVLCHRATAEAMLGDGHIRRGAADNAADSSTLAEVSAHVGSIDQRLDNVEHALGVVQNNVTSSAQRCDAFPVDRADLGGSV